MLLRRLFFIIIVSNAYIACDRTTHVSRVNRLLSRHKRYLSFPTGSNLVLTLSFIKAFLQVQPKGWNILGECDVPFALPNDTRKFLKEDKHKIRYRQRRMLYSHLEQALEKSGQNGKTCIKHLICQVQRYVSLSKEKSLTRDLLTVIFPNSEEQEGTDFCNSQPDEECTVSIFEYIIRRLLNVN